MIYSERELELFKAFGVTEAEANRIRPRSMYTWLCEIALMRGAPRWAYLSLRRCLLAFEGHTVMRLSPMWDALITEKVEPNVTRTLLIFDEGQAPKFALVDGDYSRFHDHYIGIGDIPKALENEMLDFFYDGENHERLKTELFEQPGPYVLAPHLQWRDSVAGDGDPIIVVTCGFAL